MSRQKIKRLWAGLLAVVICLAPAPAFSAEKTIERGRPVFLLDALGNILSIPKKILLLNWKIDNHKVSPQTEAELQKFLDAHPETEKNLKVRINQWTPVGEFRRLAQNKRIPWYFRVFPGIPTTAFSSLTGRVLGGDHYNPYTNTIHLFSDDAAVALHEAGHAVDFAHQKSPGLYAVGRILPPIELNQEQIASDTAIAYLKEQKDRPGELHAYKTLYPAFGTYAGEQSGLGYGNYIGAGAGHALGFLESRNQRLGYEAIDNARVGDHVITQQSPLSKSLLTHQADSRKALLSSLDKTAE